MQAAGAPEAGVFAKVQSRQTLEKHIPRVHIRCVPLPGWTLPFCCSFLITYATVGESLEGRARLGTGRWSHGLSGPARRTGGRAPRHGDEDRNDAAAAAASQRRLAPATARTNAPGPEGGCWGEARAGGGAGQRDPPAGAQRVAASLPEPNGPQVGPVGGAPVPLRAAARPGRGEPLAGG